MFNLDKRNNFGINVVGFVKGEFGLGESARSQIRSIKAANIPHIVTNMHVGNHRNLDPTFKEEDFSSDNPYAVNLLNFNAEAMPGFLDNVGVDYIKGKYNIGFWAWELPTFPPEWQWIFNYYDEIWTPSCYCADSLSIVSPIPVIRIPHSIDLPEPTIPRTALELPNDKFIFLFMFDYHSTFARKNPVAVIESFKKAFHPSNKEVLLVLKSTNSHDYQDQFNHLKERAEGFPNIQFMDGHLDRGEVNALIYNCDCYVSLHRAEGFGLTLAEAMYYGKPVIATGYSSNIDFMNVGNSFLVKYDLIEIEENSGTYKKGDIWAEADTDHAAALMKEVYQNSKIVQEVRLRGEADVKSDLNPVSVGAKIRERLEYVMSKLF